MKQTILLLIVAALSGCTDNTSHVVESFAINSTSHEVVIYYYNSRGLTGAVPTYDTLQPMETRRLLLDANEGLGGTTFPEFYSFMFDSLAVTFDRVRSSTHYDMVIVPSKGIPYSSSRNLFNPANWLEHVSKHTRRRFKATYEYTFTEQDYLDAN